jgi:hypothetical protein
MIVDCLRWRRTFRGKGIDTIYREIDLFDVSDGIAFVVVVYVG